MPTIDDSCQGRRPPRWTSRSRRRSTSSTASAPAARRPRCSTGSTVDYYGTPTPLKQLATINVPEPRMLTIQPFDPSSMKAIEKAIMESDLGLTPSNDGKIDPAADPAADRGAAQGARQGRPPAAPRRAGSRSGTCAAT